MAGVSTNRTNADLIFTGAMKAYERSRIDHRTIDEAYDDAKAWAEQVFRRAYPGPLDLALRRLNYAWRKDMLL